MQVIPISNWDSNTDSLRRQAIGMRNFVIHADRTRPRGGLRYEFQVSEDLSSDSWMDRGYTVSEITPIDETFEEVRLRINQPLSSPDPRLFGRLKIYLDE